MASCKPPNYALIVATTPNWGIGLNNDLPWKLKTDMSYFTRVTKRVHGISPEDTSKTIRNAVVMGRKTWDSIPPKYRPLNERLNVVLSRSGSVVSLESPNLSFTSLSESIRHLTSLPDIFRIYIVGGSHIYREAIESPNCTHILLTRVYRQFECDTFFPEIDENIYEQAEHEDLVRFVGEDVPKGRLSENGLEFEFLLYVRKRS
ncbi:3982_t:CDS:2 [Paraglomus brasilianum]|uniref:Dihydrofolate reductase n=1 Tax=Paraglomus brasilianum TaxID=144538 RepID=A0A9N8VIR0_9GLOM|nr:3982_t:CDS:2 [Paraglomus brasilianum]